LSTTSDAEASMVGNFVSEGCSFVAMVVAFGSDGRRFAPGLGVYY